MLDRSLRLAPAADNDAALAGLGALAAARHQFAAALRFADETLAINGYGARGNGVRIDALVELGRYPEAMAAARRADAAQPGIPIFTRVAYLFELEGRTSDAARVLQRAMDSATDPGDVALRALRKDAGHPHPHPHPHREERPASRGSVVLMGFAGGMVPSPSAVVVLVGAAALGHAWFGVALVLAYGAGLAITLTLVGLLLAGSGQWLARRMHEADTGRWLARVPVRTLPVGAAALVMVLGLGLALRGLPAALG